MYPERAVRLAMVEDKLVALNDADGLVHWRGYENSMPAFDERKETSLYVVSFMRTEGKLTGRNLKTGRYNRHPGLQVRVRGLRSNFTQNKAEQLYDAISGINRRTIIGTNYDFFIQAISMTSDIFPIPIPSQNDHRIYVFNCTSTLTVTPKIATASLTT